MRHITTRRRVVVSSNSMSFPCSPLGWFSYKYTREPYPNHSGHYNTMTEGTDELGRALNPKP